MRRHILRSALLLLPVALLACGGTEQGVRDWVLREDLRIGGGSEPLTRVGAVLPTPDGGAWVMQPADRDIRVYGEDGGLIRRVGRGGQADGEFTLPNRMGWWGASMDTVWVADLGLRRLSLFTREGEFVSSLEMPFVQHEATYSVNQPSAVRSDGTGLALAAYSPLVTDWESFPVLRYSIPDGAVIGEIASLERTGTVMIRWQDRALTTAVHPASDAPLVAFSQDGQRAYVVDRGTDAEHLGRVGILALSAEGDTLWSRSYDYIPEPIPQTELDSVVAPRIASIKEFARLEGSLTESDAEQAYRASVALPGYRPPLQSVQVGADGRIWLAWAAAPGQPAPWWVLDEEGEQVARFTAPSALDVRAVGSDVIWAVETAQNVSYLVRYRAGEGGS